MLAAQPAVTNPKSLKIDLRRIGISRFQAAELRLAFAPFEDWSAPEMDVYDDYNGTEDAP